MKEVKEEERGKKIKCCNRLIVFTSVTHYYGHTAIKKSSAFGFREVP